MPYAASAIALTDNDTRWAPSIHTDLVMFAIFLQWQQSSNAAGGYVNDLGMKHKLMLAAHCELAECILLIAVRSFIWVDAQTKTCADNHDDQIKLKSTTLLSNLGLNYSIKLH